MTDDKAQAYPLAWPVGVPRTRSPRRAKFHAKTGQPSFFIGAKRPLTVAEGTAAVRHEVPLMGGSQLVVSSNVPLKRDGLPYSGQREPDDSGAAVYFVADKRPLCFPCDQWDRVADNLRAIALHLAAMRGMERWGVGTVAQLYAGYLALPSPETVGVPAWHETLGVRPDASRDEVDAAFRRLAMAAHPDRGGDPAVFKRITEARRAGLENAR